MEFAIDTEGVAAFEAALTALGGHFHRAADLVAARRQVIDVIGTRSPMVLSREPDVEALGLEGAHWPDCGLSATSEAAVTVVGCVAMVAATGSVVVDARSARGRSLSLLPPMCIVMARRSRLVATPGDVLNGAPIVVLYIWRSA